MDFGFLFFNLFRSRGQFFGCSILVISVQDGWCLYGALVGGTDCTAAREAKDLSSYKQLLGSNSELPAASSYDDSDAYGGSGAWREQCDS